MYNSYIYTYIYKYMYNLSHARTQTHIHTHTHKTYITTQVYIRVRGRGWRARTAWGRALRRHRPRHRPGALRPPGQRSAHRSTQRHRSTERGPSMRRLRGPADMGSCVGSLSRSSVTVDMRSFGHKSTLIPVRSSRPVISRGEAAELRVRHPSGPNPHVIGCNHVNHGQRARPPAPLPLHPLHLPCMTPHTEGLGLYIVSTAFRHGLPFPCPPPPLPTASGTLPPWGMNTRLEVLGETECPCWTFGAALPARRRRCLAGARGTGIMWCMLPLYGSSSRYLDATSRYLYGSARRQLPRYGMLQRCASMLQCYARILQLGAHHSQVRCGQRARGRKRAEDRGQRSQRA